MGTPNVDRKMLTSNLARMISKKEYSHRLKGRTAWQVAESAVERALGTAAAPNLRDPIYATELRPRNFPLEFYRAYDGVDKAMTLGSWWCSKKVLKRAVYAVTPKAGVAKHGDVVQELLKIMYVHSRWNGGTDIARLAIPEGNSTPAIVGIGDPRAMGLPEDDGLGAEQYFLPLFNDMWVCKVDHLSKDWPFNR